MKLSDNEIRDITKLLEEGKPLPDKYRFVLFGDDRELELVWNGKTSEVTNVVLPFQTIEHVDEPRPESVRNQQLDILANDLIHLLVPKDGLEPSQGCPYWILNPISPPN